MPAAKKAKIQTPKVEDLTKDQVEFLNKTPLGTIMRVKKTEFRAEMTRVKKANSNVELATRPERTLPDCRGLFACCNAVCNCAFFGGFAGY